MLKIFVEPFVVVSSVSGFFKIATWFEREVWDLYGIVFSDHSDLRRIMTDYGFQGHPLRRDFPLSGFFETRYMDSVKVVVNEPLEFGQEFKFFFLKKRVYG